MSNKGLLSLIDRIPFYLILLIYILYSLYNYYIFLHDSNSPFFEKKDQIEKVKSNNSIVKNRIEDAKKFVKILELKKIEVRNHAMELQNIKGVLKEKIDVPDFIKNLLTEARRVGLNIISVKPGDSTKKEFYSEKDFKMEFEGVFFQVLSFLDRISNFSEIIRVDTLSLINEKNNDQFVLLKGEAIFKSYRYLGSKEDDIVNSGSF